jgi:beta-lactamase regulating signal transducer with metallopeptidase domain
MPTFTGLYLTIAIDVLLRVSIVLAAGLLLARAARKNAALGHAILVASLAAAILMPVTMLAMQSLPAPRLQLGWLSREEPGDSVADATVRSQPPSESQDHPASPIHPAPAIVAVGGDEVRLGPVADVSPRFNERSLGSRVRSALSTPGVRFAASALLSALWLGAIIKVAGLGLSLLRLRRIVARARPIANDQLQPVLDLIQRRIMMRHPPRVAESAAISAPVATGIIGNHVLLPEGWAGILNRGELVAVLCHESAHLARRDHRVVILQELLASVFWFHPLVYQFNRVLNRVREELCDNYAITMVERFAYCEALLRLAVDSPGATPRGAAPMWMRHWPLEDRIRGILDERRPTRTTISGVARLMTVAFMVAICGLIALPQLTASQTGDRSEMTAGGNSPPRPESGPVAHEMTRSISRSFPVPGDKTLRFENLAGRIELVPGHGPDVAVQAIVRVGDLAEGEVKRLIDAIQWVQAPAKDDSTRWGLSFPVDAYPTVRYPVEGETKTNFDTVRHLDREVRISNRNGDSIPSLEFDLRISLPPGIRVAVHNAVGPIDSDTVVSPLKLSTRHGVIKLGDVRAPIDATSEFGDVLISRLGADAVVHTGRGGIDLARISRGHVTVSTDSGHCRIVQRPETGFKLQYSGSRPLEVVGEGVSRVSALSGGRRSELLSRGTGGPSITVTSDTGDTVIETGP